MKRVLILIFLGLFGFLSASSQSTLNSVTCLTGDKDEVVVGYRRLANNDKVFLVSSSSKTGNYINEPVDSVGALIYKYIWLVYVGSDNTLKWSKNLRPILNNQTFQVNSDNYQFVVDETGIALAGAVQQADSIHGTRDNIWFLKFSLSGDTLVTPVQIDTYLQYQYNGDFRILTKVLCDKISNDSYLFALIYKNYSSGNYLVKTNAVSASGQVLGQKEFYYSRPIDIFFCKGYLFNKWEDWATNNKYLSKFDNLGNIAQTILLEGQTEYRSSVYGRQLTKDDKILFWGYQQHTEYIDSIRRNILHVDPETMMMTTSSRIFDTAGTDYFYYTYGGTTGAGFNKLPQENRSDYLADFYYTISNDQDTLVHSSLLRIGSDLTVTWDKEISVMIGNTRYAYYDNNTLITADEEDYLIVSQRLTNELYSNDSRSVLLKLNASSGDILWFAEIQETIVVNSRSYKLTRNDPLRFTNVRDGAQYYLVTYYQEITPNFLMTAIYKLDVITGEMSIGGTFFVSGNFALHADDFYIDENGQPWIAGYSVSPVFCSEDYQNNVVVLKLSTNYNTVKGKIYIDYNNNNVQDGGEPNYTNGFITHTKGSVTKNNFIYYNNQYEVTTDTGKYIFKFLPVSALFTVSPASKTINRTTYNNTDVANFALKPSGVVHDADVLMINPFFTRLGRNNSYVLSCSNQGNYPVVNGTAKLLLDNRLTVTSSGLPYAVSNDTLLWPVGYLNPGDRKDIEVTFVAAIPPDLNIGDTLISKAFISIPESDQTPWNNSWTLFDFPVGAYDPNDKTVNAESLDPSALARNTPLTYTIRFENLGNDTAFTVIIKDTLPDNVDLRTLQPIASSHPYSLDVVNGKYLTFTFNNILLPAKAEDSAKSHGYISYQVVPVSGFSSGNYEIKNTAHIYFDYNLPVTTNTAITRVQLVTAVHQDPAIQHLVRVYPNPARDQLIVDLQKLKGEKVQLKLYDGTGKLVQSQITTATQTILNISRLATGTYLLQAEMKEGVSAIKVIITD